MTALNRLTTLERTRDWVGVNTNNDDIFLSRLIDETSRFILSYLQRPTLFHYLFTDIHDGNGGYRQMLRHWPVQSITSVMVDEIAVPMLSGMPGSGYILEPWDGLPPGSPQSVSLRGYAFCKGLSNVSIAYTAGFSIVSEAQSVPSGGNYTIAVNAPYGSFGADQGVTYASGVTLTNVTANPAVGQYTVSNGIYGFASADANAAVLVSYSYVPADIEHACIELIGERYRYRNRIGEISKSLGGQETISFNQKDMPDYIRLLLQPYRRVILV
jgi:hypothetical protein